MGIAEDNEHLEDLDRQYIWHPFTQMKEWVEERPLVITEGRDCFIKDRLMFHEVSALAERDMDGKGEGKYVSAYEQTRTALGKVPKQDAIPACRGFLE